MRIFKVSCTSEICKNYKERRAYVFVLPRAWDQGKNLGSHEESNLRPSDYALRCSGTEPQRLYGERGFFFPLTTYSFLAY